MSFLKFEKKDLINLEFSINKELLRTSRNGSYCCTTIVGCNTRRYHGLLVSPQPQIDSELHIMLSSFDETVVQHDIEFNLGLHKYQGDYYAPKGHKYLHNFECDTIPKHRYKVGGVDLLKELIFVSGEDLLLMRYTLIDAHSETTLRFRPFLAFRNQHHLTHANLYANHHYKNCNSGVSFKLYDQYADLYIQLSKSCEFISNPNWYYNIEYRQEQERGYEYQEDLFVPGYFEVSIEKGESIVFGVGLSELNPKLIKRKFTTEERKRISRINLKSALQNSGHQFFINHSKGTDIVAGFPWFKSRARDMFIAFPGLKIALHDQQTVNKVEKKIITDLRHYIKKGEYPQSVTEYNCPDILIWASWSFLKLLEYNRNWKPVYMPELELIFEAIERNTNSSLQLRANGLLWCEGKTAPASWMNGMYCEKPSNPRHGYLVEINSIWYSLVAYIAQHSVDDAIIERTKLLKEQIETVFTDIFLNKADNILYDYVNDEECNNDLRPNMIFAISMEHSPISTDLQKQIIDVISIKLLTPKGLRSLSPDSLTYDGELRQEHNERNKQYHQGSVWPWLLGSYTDAFMKIYKQNSIIEINHIIEAFTEEMNCGCIGTISEYYAGNPPHIGGGAISFAINVAETLRIIDKLENGTTKTFK